MMKGSANAMLHPVCVCVPVSWSQQIRTVGCLWRCGTGTEPPAMTSWAQCLLVCPSSWSPQCVDGKDMSLCPFLADLGMVLERKMTWSLILFSSLFLPLLVNARISSFLSIKSGKCNVYFCSHIKCCNDAKTQLS